MQFAARYEFSSTNYHKLTNLKTSFTFCTFNAPTKVKSLNIKNDLYFDLETILSSVGWSDFSFFKAQSFTINCLCILVHKVGQDQIFQGQGQRSILRATGRCPRSSAYNSRISSNFEKKL